MKKLLVSALCGLCLMGAFVCAAQPAQDDNAATELALSRSRLANRG